MENIKIPDVTAKLTRDKKQFKIRCPYCSREHTHGAGKDKDAYGHRVAHCHSKDANNVGYNLIPEK